MKTRQILGLFAALAFVMAAGAAQAKTWVVGTLPLTKNANFTTISQAVAAASNGDTIKVGPGVYVESVTVNKTLTIDGAGHTEEVVGHPLNPSRQTIVKPSSPTMGFGLYANNIEVMDITFVDSGLSTAAMFTSPAFSGYDIHDNAFTGNSIALYLNSNGVCETEVVGNTFANNDIGYPNGGVAIFSDLGLGNVEIERNAFSSNAGCDIDLAPTSGFYSDISIERNTSDDDGNFTFLVRCRRVSINRNVVNSASNYRWSQIGLVSCSDVCISENTLRGGLQAIRLVGATVQNSRISISMNALIDQQLYGIQVDAGAMTNSSIDRNVIANNGVAGARILFGNNGNVITDNYFKTNKSLDAIDLSVGSGTANTGNLWDNNHLSTDNHAGALGN